METIHGNKLLHGESLMLHHLKAKAEKELLWKLHDHLGKICTHLLDKNSTAIFRLIWLISVYYNSDGDCRCHIMCSFASTFLRPSEAMHIKWIIANHSAFLPRLWNRCQGVMRSLFNPYCHSMMPWVMISLCKTICKHLFFGLHIKPSWGNQAQHSEQYLKGSKLKE